MKLHTSRPIKRGKKKLRYNGDHSLTPEMIWILEQRRNIYERKQLAGIPT